jgi:hypothetical protein
MKCVYETSTGLDAHMILNLLEQEGISGRVDGEYLQGGIGELQPMNFVRVLVSEDDYAEAKKIINDWELVQPASDRTEREDRQHTGSFHFITGVAVGAVIMYWILMWKAS